MNKKKSIKILGSFFENLLYVAMFIFFLGIICTCIPMIIFGGVVSIPSKILAEEVFV